jgi:hypothetical protein
MPEFFIAITIVIFICGTAVYISVQKNSELDYIKTKESASVLCNTISSSIDEVWTMNSGATIILNVPAKLNFQNYTAQITSQTISISFLSNAVICPFVAKVTNGTSSSFNMAPGNLNIYNNQDSVVLSVA